MIIGVVLGFTSACFKKWNPNLNNDHHSISVSGKNSLNLHLSIFLQNHSLFFLFNGIVLGFTSTCFENWNPNLNNDLHLYQETNSLHPHFPIFLSLITNHCFWNDDNNNLQIRQLSSPSVIACTCLKPCSSFTKIHFNFN